MSIVKRRHEPFADLMRPFERMRSLLERDFELPENWFTTDHILGSEVLALDVVDKNGDILVKTAVPGIKEEDIDISYDNGILTIQAESKEEKEEKEENWYVHELRYGKFSRSVRLPAEVNLNKAEATVENGMLTVKLPKTKASALQRIAVNAKKLASGKKD